MLQAPQNSPEEAENAARVAAGEGEPAQQQMQIVAVGLFAWRRGSSWRPAWFLLRPRRGDRGRRVEREGRARASGLRRAEPGSCPGCTRETCGGVTGALSRVADLVQADGDGLAEIHGGLAGVGGNLDEEVAESEIVAGEAALSPGRRPGPRGRRERVRCWTRGASSGAVRPAAPGRDRRGLRCRRRGCTRRAPPPGAPRIWRFGGVPRSRRRTSPRASAARRARRR